MLHSFKRLDKICCSYILCNLFLSTTTVVLLTRYSIRLQFIVEVIFDSLSVKKKASSSVIVLSFDDVKKYFNAFDKPSTPFSYLTDAIYNLRISFFSNCLSSHKESKISVIFLKYLF